MQQGFRRELISNLEEALETLSDVSEQILDLTNDFQKFQVCFLQSSQVTKIVDDGVSKIQTRLDQHMLGLFSPY